MYVLNCVLIQQTNYNTDDLNSEAIWTAAEPSIAVVCACLPSLRPLFVRLLPSHAYRPRTIRDSVSRQDLTSSWRSDKIKSFRGSSLEKSRESSGIQGKPWPWRANQVTVFGGRELGVEDCELEDNASVVPENRIRAKTTVVLTISDRIEWQDDLF